MVTTFHVVHHVFGGFVVVEKNTNTYFYIRRPLRLLERFLNVFFSRSGSGGPGRGPVGGLAAGRPHHDDALRHHALLGAAPYWRRTRVEGVVAGVRRWRPEKRSTRPSELLAFAGQAGGDLHNLTLTS